MCAYQHVDIHIKIILNELEVFKNQGWNNGLVVKSIYCSSRVLQFDSQHHVRWLTAAYNSSSRGI